mmetsp:Transcript_8172/g.16552  ORF Transcript_8172/g.16552 Transcript_8172/m.16552 type:complete len:97 (+) Transcript_8172:103-393(+)
MHLLFETPAGYSLFKITDDKKLSKTSEDDLHDKFFADASKAKKIRQPHPLRTLRRHRRRRRRRRGLHRRQGPQIPQILPQETIEEEREGGQPRHRR